MRTLGDNLVNHIYDYSIGDKTFWKSKFRNVVNDITHFHVDDIVYEYFSGNHAKPKDLGIDSINCRFYLDDNKFKQSMINNILHILKCSHH